MNKLFFLCAPLVLTSFWSEPRQIPAETPPIEFFPAETLALVEVRGAGTWLTRARVDRLVELARERGWLDTTQRRKLVGALGFAQLTVGIEPVDRIGQLAAEGLVIGMLPNATRPAYVLVMEGRDAETLEDTLSVLLELLENKFDVKGQFQTPHTSPHGAEVWNLGDKFAVARLGATLLAAQDEATLERLLDQAAGETPGLLESANFTRAEEAAQLSLWFDLADTKAHAEQYDLDAKKLQNLAKLPGIPQVQFLVGPGIADLGSAERFTASVTFDAAGIGAELRGLYPTVHTGLEPDGGAPPRTLASAGALASGHFYRDLAGIVSRRNELFAPELQPKFSKALGDLALLFGGMQLDDDLLPAIEPWVEVTVHDMDFGSRPRPDLALPGVALILTVDPALRDTLVAGFQTTLGITNTQRTQNGEAAFTMGLALESGVLITSGHQPRPQPGEAVDNSFNLAPSAAYVEGPAKGWFVLGTHEAIVGAVVRELLARGSDEASPGPRAEELYVDAGALAALVRTSRDHLAMQAVLDEGKSFEEAAGELDVLASVIDTFQQARLAVEYLAGGDVRLGLQLDLRVPFELKPLAAKSDAERR